jgi:hypothetical protein
MASRKGEPSKKSRAQQQREEQQEKDKEEADRRAQAAQDQKARADRRGRRRSSEDQGQTPRDIRVSAFGQDPLPFARSGLARTPPPGPRPRQGSKAAQGREAHPRVRLGPPQPRARTPQHHPEPGEERLSPRDTRGRRPAPNAGRRPRLSPQRQLRSPPGGQRVVGKPRGVPSRPIGRPAINREAPPSHRPRGRRHHRPSPPQPTLRSALNRRIRQTSPTFRRGTRQPELPPSLHLLRLLLLSRRRYRPPSQPHHQRPSQLQGRQLRLQHHRRPRPRRHPRHHRPLHPLQRPLRHPLHRRGAHLLQRHSLTHQ